MERLTPDGAWCFFADPRAVFFEGKHVRTYLGWLNSHGDVVVCSYDHHTHVIETSVIKDHLQIDDHANPALHIDEDGKLTVFYSAHNGQHMYYRQSAEAESVEAWSEEYELPVNTEGKHGYTYPNPIHLADENKHFLFWRGGNFKPTFSITSDLQTWSEPFTLIEGDGHRPYIKYASDGKGIIFFAYTDGHPNVEQHNSMYCAFYQKGAIYKPDGTQLKLSAELPFSPNEADRVYDAERAGGRAWIWDIALDAEGHPVIVYTVVYALTDHRYRYARWTGSCWEDHEITKAGKWFPQTPAGQTEKEPYYSGGIILDHVHPDIVYLSREINGVFEIERWKTSDRGRSWSAKSITSHSSKNNVRPLVSRCYVNEEAILFWMHGDYIHFTKYDTELRMLKITSDLLKES